jgi:hypothetical protein
MTSLQQTKPASITWNLKASLNLVLTNAVSIVQAPRNKVFRIEITFAAFFWVSHFFYPQGKSKGYHWFTNDVCMRASGPLQNVIFTGITWKTSKKPAMSQDSLLKRDVSHLHRSCYSTVKSPSNYHEPRWTPQVRDPCVIHAWSMREPPLLGVNPLFLAWTTREPHRPQLPTLHLILCKTYPSNTSPFKC